jgi:ABC-type amino acid transport substrate-binding protein
MRLWLKTINLVYLLLVSNICLAASKLTFGVNAPGSPPYLYLAKNSREYLGVIPDILTKLQQLHGYQIRYIDSFRKRTETSLYKGNIDGFLSSAHWLEYPDKLIYSEPLGDHNSYFYSNQPFSKQLKLEDISGAEVCTRRGYIYPTLASSFSSGKLQRVDSSNQLSMLNMVKINRCDMAVMHEYNALTILSSSDFQTHKIYQSQFPVDVVHLSIILRPELIEVKRLLDDVIINMKNSGELEKSLEHHIKVAM